MLRKTGAISLHALPILIMIGLIPFVPDERLLAILYLAVIGIALTMRRDPKDFVILWFGFCIMILAEALFVSTGVETFTHRGLFGLMPLWLPILWAYGFVAMRRGIRILES